MRELAVPAALVVAAYAVGAIPWGLLMARWVAGVDVRTVGSGNVGATNVSRVLGRKWFPVVFLLDAAKGAVPVLLFPRLAGHSGSAAFEVICGLAAMLGHVFNPFLHFKGGKGVATGAGVMLALAPAAIGAALGVFALMVLAFRYVSLASVAAAIALVPLTLLFRTPIEVVVFTVLAAAVIVVRHRANLGRIAAGTEPRVFVRKAAQHG